jgi:hypothetical protein
VIDIGCISTYFGSALESTSSSSWVAAEAERNIRRLSVDISFTASMSWETFPQKGAPRPRAPAPIGLSSPIDCEPGRLSSPLRSLLQVANVKARARLHRRMLDEAGHVLRDHLCRGLVTPDLVLEGFPVKAEVYCIVIVTPPTAADTSAPTRAPLSCRMTPLAFCNCTPPAPAAIAPPAPATA